MRQARTLLILLAAAALLSGCAGADNANTGNVNRANTATTGNANGNTSATQQRGATPSDSDREFMTAAAQGGMMEVEVGRLAAQRASNSAVKQFGQRMVDDHGKANSELKQLAATKGVTLPTEMKPEQKEMTDKLSKLSGAEFEREYVSEMVKDHEKDVEEFQEQAEDGSDADVKAFASKTLPTLRQHLQMIRDIKAKM